MGSWAMRVIGGGGSPYILYILYFSLWATLEDPCRTCRAVANSSPSNCVLMTKSPYCADGTCLSSNRIVAMEEATTSIVGKAREEYVKEYCHGSNFDRNGHPSAIYGLAV